jgi:hypothetical protein
VPDSETIAELRQNKATVLAYLRIREQSPYIQLSSSPVPMGWKTEKLENWPPDSLGAERRFGRPHAKLFLFVGRKVRTPAGPGTLLQVFAESVTVLLDQDVKKCSRFSPSEIEPVSKDWST